METVPAVFLVMIWESQYWKEDLVRAAVRLQKRRKQRSWSEISLAKLEKEIFIGFYSIRRLLEARKLSESVVKQTIAAKSFQYTGRQRITLLNWNSKVFSAYDFEKPTKVNLSVAFLCNQVIHSFIYKEVFEESGTLSGIFICSDCEKTRKIYFLEIGAVVKLFARVGRDYPSHFEAHFDPESGDYFVRNW